MRVILLLIMRKIILSFKRVTDLQKLTLGGNRNKERIADEKQVERLYRDITNGGLRRKRGADIDLFDSDDEEEAASRRRAVKQREFARMRKELLKDEKLGKLGMYSSFPSLSFMRQGEFSGGVC